MIAERSIKEADKDGQGYIVFEEFEEAINEIDVEGETVLLCLEQDTNIVDDVESFEDNVGITSDCFCVDIVLIKVIIDVLPGRVLIEGVDG